jgi:peptide/nickel transport system substrate-binding protein
MRTRVLPLLTAALASAIVLAGCSAGTDAATDEQGGEPRAGGTLRVSVSSDFSCLDGQQARGGELNIASQLLEGLTEQDPETGELVGRLATGWEVNDDASAFTFALRDDVVFHDGTPFTAQSVADNFTEVANLGARSSLGQTYLAGLRGVEVVDEHTARVVFDGPNAQFLQATSTVTLGFYAAQTLAKTPEERCQGDVIGTGPFVFEAYTGNQTVELVRNEDYGWASSIADHEGPAYLEGIVFTVTPEASVRNGSLLSGQTDVDTAVTVQDRPNLEAQGFPVVTYANPGAPTNLWPNVTSGPLADPAVRSAISRALDRDELSEVLFEEQEGATNTVSQSTPGYASQAELLSHDPELAGELLDDAGWTLGADGVREKDGERLEISITDYYQYNYIELIQEQLAEVGVAAEINTVTFAERSAILESGDFEFITGNLTRADPDIIRTIYSIDQQNTLQRTERIPLDDELEATLAIGDEAERAAALTGPISQQLIEQGYAIPLVETLAVLATGENVHGYRFDATARQSYYDTWLS